MSSLLIITPKYIQVNPPKFKYDVIPIFEKFKKIYFQPSIVIIYLYNRGDYQGNSSCCSKILVSNTYLSLPIHLNLWVQMNVNIVILLKQLTLPHHASLPLSFQSIAFQTTLYLTNFLPTPVFNHQSSFEILFIEDASFNYIKL